MSAKMQAMKQELRSFLTGWLAVALLAPMLLGMLPQPTAVDLLRVVDPALCSKADQKQDQHQSHDQDCPCCLSGGMVSHAAPPIATALQPMPIVPRVVALVPAEWVTPAHRPHDLQLARKTGPPNLLFG
jgi:hypothetical protein